MTFSNLLDTVVYFDSCFLLSSWSLISNYC